MPILPSSLHPGELKLLARHYLPYNIFFKGQQTSQPESFLHIASPIGAFTLFVTLLEQKSCYKYVTRVQTSLFNDRTMTLAVQRKTTPQIRRTKELLLFYREKKIYPTRLSENRLSFNYTYTNSI